MKINGLLVVGLVVVAGCAGRWGGPERQPGSALQVAGGKLSAPQLADLEGVGIRELFVEAGRLSWEADVPTISPTLSFDAPRRLSCTLVVRGAWPEGQESVAAADLLRQLEDLRVAAEEKGLFATGFHLELQGLSDPSFAGEVVRGLQRDLDPQLLLSATIPRDLLEHADIKELTKALDFVVVLLYGQRPGEAEVAKTWDFQQVELGTRALEELGTPYLVGVSILGSTTLLENGRVLATTTEVGLGDLVNNRALAVEHGFTLEGIDRQVYSFRAEQSTQAGSLAVTAGQRLRLVRSSTPHLEELSRLFGAWNTPGRLGELYVRMPDDRDRTGLAVENLVNALGPSPIMPDPDVTIESLAPGSKTLRLRVRLENRSLEPTDIGFVGHNFVELVASQAFWNEVDAGSFQRFDLLKPDRSGELMRSLQRPTVLRFYVPLLEAGQVYESGVIELWPTDVDPRIQVGANFLVPSGRSASFGPREWQLGAGN